MNNGRRKKLRAVGKGERIGLEVGWRVNEVKRKRKAASRWGKIQRRLLLHQLDESLCGDAEKSVFKKGNRGVLEEPGRE